MNSRTKTKTLLTILALVPAMVSAEPVKTWEKDLGGGIVLHVEIWEPQEAPRKNKQRRRIGLRQTHDKENFRIDLMWSSKGHDYSYWVYRLRADGSREPIFFNWREVEGYEMRVWYYYGQWADFGHVRIPIRYEDSVVLQVVEIKDG